ncbi:MAG: hypothetical protein FWH08_03780 [Oscillospiraceae bacterium]|nr:hypothetical protein [Oscillospiraceae bacterium]
MVHHFVHHHREYRQCVSQYPPPTARGFHIFPAGVVLDIPEIKAAAVSGLPPWKE